MYIYIYVSNSELGAAEALRQRPMERCDVCFSHVVLSRSAEWLIKGFRKNANTNTNTNASTNTNTNRNTNTTTMLILILILMPILALIPIAMKALQG